MWKAAGRGIREQQAFDASGGRADNEMQGLCLNLSHGGGCWQSSLLLFVALRAYLKVRRPDCSPFLPAPWTSDLSCEFSWLPPPSGLSPSLHNSLLPHPRQWLHCGSSCSPGDSVSLMTSPRPPWEKPGPLGGELGSFFLCSLPLGPDLRVSGLPFPFRAGAARDPVPSPVFSGKML